VFHVYTQQKIFDRYVDLLLPAFVALCYFADKADTRTKPEGWDRAQVPMGLLQIALALALVGFVQLQSFDRAIVWQSRMRNQLSMARNALAAQAEGGPGLERRGVGFLTFSTNPEKTLGLLKEARAAGILPASLVR